MVRKQKAPSRRVFLAGKQTSGTSSHLQGGWPSNKFCYLCHDGGSILLCCNHCPRIVCQRCLGLSNIDDATICNTDVTFICPGCHEIQTRYRKHEKMPYFGLLKMTGTTVQPIFPQGIQVSGICERASNSQVCAEPVIVLHFVCSGISPLGSPADLLRVILEEYHVEGTLHCEQITFDFGTDKKSADWHATANQLADSLISAPFTRKIIFISTHSDVERGDLFGGQNDDGTDVAMEVTCFMTTLFAGKLRSVVCDSTIFLLTCGPVVRIAESFIAMKDAVKLLKPEYVVAFNANYFLSTVLKSFIVAYASRVLVEGQHFLNVLQSLLDRSLDLPMHTDTFVFHMSGLRSPKAPFLIGSSTQQEAVQPALVGYRYTWYHSHRRPWGTSLPMGCPECHSIRPWGPSTRPKSKVKDRISRCTKIGCSASTTSKPPSTSYQLCPTDDKSGWICSKIFMEAM